MLHQHQHQQPCSPPHHLRSRYRPLLMMTWQMTWQTEASVVGILLTVAQVLMSWQHADTRDIDICIDNLRGATYVHDMLTETPVKYKKHMCSPATRRQTKRLRWSRRKNFACTPQGGGSRSSSVASAIAGPPFRRHRATARQGSTGPGRAHHFPSR